MIRAATAADLPAVRAIEAQAATAAHWTEDDYRHLLAAEPRRLALVVEEETILGFLVARQLGPEWELENIVIAEPAQRRGLGTALVGSFLDIVREQNGASVFLEVRASNAAARALYEKHGFHQSGRRRHYYRHPVEDAVLYHKAVAPGE